MTHEPWADSQLSQALPLLVQGGESETVEFKRELPRQVRDLAKEIAAFASTEGGQVLVGVGDDGEILGIPNVHAPDVRDELERRIVGVCQTIDPPMRPKIGWASADGGGVMVITVEKGKEPLYYVDSRAYIRHASVSRPATPAEVQAVLSARLPEIESPPRRPSTHTELSALADVLASVRRWCDMDSEMRSLQPWGDDWSAAADVYASKLRDLAISDWALTSQMVNRLDAVAEKLDEVAQFRHYLGAGADFDHLCSAVGAAAEQLMHDLVDPVGIADSTQREVLAAVETYARKLTQMWDRARTNVFDGRVERAQEESYQIGQEIAKWTYFRLSLLPDGTLLALRRIGLGLLQLASLRVYMDGGDSLTRIVDEAQELVRELAARVNTFPQTKC